MATVMPFPPATLEPPARSAARAEVALIARAQAGDQMAFFEIVDCYQTRVYSIIHRLLRDRSEAEDVAQEVFASAFFAIRRYRHTACIMTWLYRITVNKCYEHLRRKRARPLTYEAEFTEESQRMLASRSSVPPAETEALDRDLALKLLANLGQRDRALLLMKEVEGYSLEELSRMEGVTEAALRIRLFRARKKLLKAARSMTIARQLSPARESVA
jgi:RNA polymerase sigma-70 factor (ECF subfamily)